MQDLISTLPTDTYDAQRWYDAYWAVATSEDNVLAVSTSPVYRWIRENMLRAIMTDYSLTISQVIWLYDYVLPEGPGWGSLPSMIDYGRDNGFGLKRMAEALSDCLTCSQHVDYEPGRHHAIDCPLRVG
jgi:hypothetical protein